MIKRVIENRKIMFFFVVLVILVGLYTYKILPKQEAPDISPQAALITTIYPGASQSNVEQLVTRKIEDEVSNMDGYNESYSYSNNSVSTVVVQYQYGVDVDKTFNELRRKMDDLQSELPSEAYDIQVNTDLADTAGILIALSSENYSYETLSYYGKNITDELSQIDGVSKFEVIGEVEKQVSVDVDYASLNRLNLSLSDILQLIQSQNLEIPSGKIDDGQSKINLTIDGTFDQLEDIENLIIGVSQDNGSVIRLKDIAHVYYENKQANAKYLHEGQKAILLTGYFEKGRNVITIGKDVRKSINDIKSDLPENLHFNEVVFQPEDVSNSISGFIRSLLMGIVLVIIVVFIGMGARNAIIVSLAIPLSILATFAILPLFNISIHQISVTALIVALGMLVDNAIVVSDSIQLKLDKGDDKLSACVDGAKEVSIPVLSSTLTTVAAFSPLMMLESLAGDFVKSLPIIVVLALAASYVIALFVTPSMAYIFFKPQHHSKKMKMENTFIYKMLNHALQHKKRSFGIAILMIGLLASSLIFTDITFFPKADKDVMYIDIKADKNIDIDYTKKVTDQIEDLLSQEKGIKYYTTAIGGGLPKFYTTMSITTDIPDNAQILLKVDLDQTPFKKNTPYLEYLQNKIDSHLVGGEATVKELEYAEPIGSPINVRFFGDDLAAIEAASDQAIDILESIEGSKNVRSDLSKKTYEFNIDVDEAKATYLGITKYDLLNEVSIALSGRATSTLRANGNENDIVVKSDINSIEDIENMMIKSSVTGNKILVKDVAQVNLKEVTPTITRFDKKYSVRVSSDVVTNFSRSDVEKAFKSRFNEIDLNGVSYEFDGESEMITKYFGNLGIAAIAALLIIFTILMIQFKSFKQPFIILFTVPLASAGSLFGLFMVGQPLSFTALLGIISLIGIVVNNAIVLLDFINGKRDQGLSVDAACREASVVRFRPIILSTITTVIGLIPLAFSNSELFKPMAVALMSGLLISTLLTLVFVPLVYSMVYHKDQASHPESE